MSGGGRTFRRKTYKFWDICTHSKPLSASEILKIMPINKDIDDIYKKMTRKK